MVSEKNFVSCLVSLSEFALQMLSVKLKVWAAEDVKLEVTAPAFLEAVKNLFKMSFNTGVVI